MFGLEDQKKKKTQPFVFDLEKDLKDPKKFQEIKTLLEERVQKLKTQLREGESQETYNKLGVLLYGYTSIMKVVARINAAKESKK